MVDRTLSSSTPLYNSRIVDTYLRLIKQKYPYVSTSELLAHAGMEPFQVADQGHWFSQDQINRFHDYLSQATGNPGIAREAGQYAASPDAIGVMRQYILGLVGPSRAFELIREASANFTRSSAYTSKRLGPSRVEVTVTPEPGVDERPFQCENRMGFFEAMVTAFERKNPRVVHTSCIFRGDAACRYEVSWEDTLSVRLRRIRNLAAFPLVALSLIFLIVMPVLALQTIVPISAAIFFLFSVGIGRIERRELQASLDHLRDSTVQLVDQMNANYNNTLIANEIGRAISRQTKIDDILASVVRVLHRRLDFDRGMILLSDVDRKRLCFRAGFGYESRLVSLLEGAAFHLDHHESQGVFVVSFRDQKPFLINDINEIQSHLSPRSLDFAKRMGVQSFICCPIICDGESVGILAVDNLNSRRPLVQSDMNLLMGIAPVIGISIHNAELLETSRRQFGSILKVLAASIDARDPLTAGHSDKVTEYALGICVELNLSGEFIEMIRVAALLHDYGKIGVPDVILKKEGRLTEEEYEIVKTHTSKTRDILEQVGFRGIFSDVPMVAACHHEKLDGTGYPYGLKGEEIPLGARIIGVADFFEAITAKRHYRNPMTLNDAFALLREGSGTSFDSRVVEAMIRYYVRVYIGAREGSAEVPVPPRRREIRVPCETHVAISTADAATLLAFGTNVSERGIYVAGGTETVSVGESVDLSFTLPETQGEKTVVAKGRVAWVNSRCDRKKPILPVGFGVEFLDVNPLDAIRSFVQSRIPQMA